VGRAGAGSLPAQNQRAKQVPIREKVPNIVGNSSRLEFHLVTIFVIIVENSSSLSSRSPQYS
jgi:hypothetical protein